MARSDLNQSSLQKPRPGANIGATDGPAVGGGSKSSEDHRTGASGDQPVTDHATSPPAKATYNHPLPASNAKFLFCAVGVFVSFFVFGIFQERLTRGVYGDGERFHYTLTMVFVQCVVNAVYARIAMTVSREPRDTTPRGMYGWSALSYLGAMLSSNQALQYVNYPTQVLGKSCKPIPVMLFGVAFAHKRYSLRKYMFVLAIVVGVAVFFYESGKKHSEHEAKEIGFGEILLCLSLFMDGVTGAVQDRMRASYKTRSNSMMMWMNIFSSGILFLGIIGTGELFEVLSFISWYPSVLQDLFTFAICSAVGQYFIFMTVADFGPLPCSIITTTRKFFTILVSVLFFNNPISSVQWAATFLVFLGLSLDMVYGKDRKH